MIARELALERESIHEPLGPDPNHVIIVYPSVTHYHSAKSPSECSEPEGRTMLSALYLCARRYQISAAGRLKFDMKVLVFPLAQPRFPA